MNTKKKVELLEPIKHTGNELINKVKTDVRFGCQNTHGIKLNKGLKALPQTAVIDVLQTNVKAHTENNIPWTTANKEKLRQVIETYIANVKIAASLCRDRDHDQER